jgi:hypothetical protein
MIAPALRTPGTAQPTNPEQAGETRPEKHVDTATDAVPVNPDGAVAPLVSADQIHGDLMQAFRDGNRARLRFRQGVHRFRQLAEGLLPNPSS